MARNWLSMIVRFTALAAVVCNVLAMVVGRLHAPVNSQGDSSALTAPSPVAMTGLVVNPSFFRSQGDSISPLYYNVENSRFERIPLANGESFDAISFAPTTDKDGRRMMVGRWRRWSGQGSEAVISDIGIARMCYPTGELVEFTSTEILPVEPPCWSPPELARNVVIFAAGDGRAYRIQMGEQDATDGDDHDDSSPVSLGIDKKLIETHGKLRLQDLHWCSLPGLERIVLASVCVLPHSSGSSARFSKGRAWWFRLDSTLSMFEDGGPLLPRTAPDTSDESSQQRHPKIVPSTAGFGGIQVVYLEQADREGAWHLRTTPMTVAIGTDLPMILPRTRKAQTLADGCLPHALGLSVDGCWVAAARTGPDRKPRIERFRLNSGTHDQDPPAGRQSPGRPSRTIAAR